MVDFKDEVDEGFNPQMYKRVFNENPVAKDNDLKVVSSSIDSLKNVLLICSFLFVIVGVLYIYVFSGQDYSDQVYNNFTIENNLTIQNNVSVPIPQINVFIEVENNTLYNITNYSFNSSVVSNATNTS